MKKGRVSDRQARGDAGAGSVRVHVHLDRPACGGDEPMKIIGLHPVTAQAVAELGARQAVEDLLANAYPGSGG